MAYFGHAKSVNSVIVHHCSFIFGVFISISKEPGNFVAQFRESFITFPVLEQNVDHTLMSRGREQNQ